MHRFLTKPLPAPADDDAVAPAPPEAFVMAGLIAAFDWSKTAIGPQSSWPTELVTIVNFMLSAPRPIVVLWGPEGILLYNDYYAGFAGNRHPGLLGMPVLDAWPEAADLNRTVMATSFHRGEPLVYSEQKLQLNRSGKFEDLWTDLSYSPVLDPAGKPLGVFALVLDVTTRVRARQQRQAALEQLKNSESFTRSVINSSTDCIKIVDTAGNLLAMNEGGMCMMEIDDFSVYANKPWASFWGEDDKAHIRSAIESALKGENSSFEGFSPTAKGTPKWWEVVVTPIRDGKGDILNVLAVSRDITERRSKDAELVATADRLRLLATITEEARGLESPEEIMVCATRLVGEYFNASRCAYATVASDANHFTILHNYLAPGAVSTVGTYELDSFGAKTVATLLRGQTLVISDTEGDSDIPDGKARFTAIDVRAVICVPLLKNGRLLAMMALHSAAPRFWSEDEIQLFEAVAESCWAYIESAASQARLKESETRFRTMADLMAQMIWVTQPDGYHEYYNKRWYEFTGVPDGSTDGEGWSNMFHPDDQERAWARWQHSLATGEPYEIEYRLRRHDGVYCWVLGRALPERNEQGRIVKWYGTCTEIEDLKKAQEQAEGANIAKTEFLANMSHEIRTPMNAVIGLANIIAQSEPLTDKQKQYIKTLQLSADSLLALINDLLDIAKIEARTVQLEEIPFNISDIIEQVMSLVAVRAAEKNLKFIVQDDFAKGKTYIGDPTRIRQIILNLCSNAVKFTDRGSITIGLSNKDEDVVCIIVKDTGIGIPAQQLDTIFHKFVQADSSINRRYGGTGLGLAITKTLTELLGGTIEVESEVGVGSTFTVCIPLKVQGVPEGHDHSTEHCTECEKARQHAEQAKAEQLAEVDPVERSRVLLVEDYEPNVLVASIFLEEFGYDWDSASNGVEAIDKVKNAGPYSAILMDVQMHGMNGFTATQLIREYEAQHNLPRVPIIGMTAHALSGDRDRCIAAGMDDYLSKPYSPGELQGILARTIAEAALKRA